MYVQEKEYAMNRILKLQFKLLNKITEYEQLDMERDYPLHWERVHLGSCTGIGQILAIKRGVDLELAAMACAIHDYGRIITGKQADHAVNAYAPLKEFLTACAMFSSEEVELLALSARNHSSKAETGTAIEEIVKDADVLDCYYYGQELARPEQRERLARVYAELGMEQ